MKQRGWILFSGFLWLAIGMLLMYKGLRLMAETVALTGQKQATVLVAIGLLIGFVKGRFVLVKTVRRVVARIASLPAPIRFKEAYTPAYWALIGGMMALGMLFRYLPIPADFRGVIDIAIGSALINGAMLYFRSAESIPKRSL